MSFRLFQTRHWGGYHFPRHWNLFDQQNLRLLASRAGFTVDHMDTIVSPVNWTYSIHNFLVDWHAPHWLVRRFTLASPVSLGVFTIVDRIFQLMGRGGLVRAVIRKPLQPSAPGGAMADASRKPIAMLGAGLAGVTAAAALRERGIPFRLYEAGKRIAGLAASYKDAQGFTNDFGAHFITNRLAAAIGVAAHCRDVEHYGEAVMLGGKAYHYPFGLLRNPRFGLSGLAARLRGGPARPSRWPSISAATYGRGWQIG